MFTLRCSLAKFPLLHQNQPSSFTTKNLKFQVHFFNKKKIEAFSFIYTPTSLFASKKTPKLRRRKKKCFLGGAISYLIQGKQAPLFLPLFPLFLPTIIVDNKKTMSSSVCQGLQSCLEPRLVEPRFLRLKLAPAPAKPNFSASSSVASHPPLPQPQPQPNPLPCIQVQQNANECKLMKQSLDMGGWSFLQSLPKGRDSSSSHNNDKVYVHPLVKRSASMLTEKSLEMCTESLGSETGSEVSSEVSSDVDVPSLPLEAMAAVGVCSSSPKAKEKRLATRKMSRSSSFPPPLTSISGSNGVQVRSHREGGRLLLQAVSIPTCHSYFHAERSEGRLRLSLFKDATPISQSQEEEEEEEEEEEAYDDDEAVDEAVDEEVEEMEENRDEIGKAKLGRASRRSCCKDSGRGHNGLLDWEPRWVATKCLMASN